MVGCHACRTWAACPIQSRDKQPFYPLIRFVGFSTPGKFACDLPWVLLMGEAHPKSCNTHLNWFLIGWPSPKKMLVLPYKTHKCNISELGTTLFPCVSCGPLVLPPAPVGLLPETVYPPHMRHCALGFRARVCWLPDQESQRPRI